MLAHDLDFAGFMAGFARDVVGNRLSLGAGVAESQIRTDEDSTELDGESVFGGAYLTVPAGAATITGGLIAGVESFDSQRHVLDNLARAEVATARMDSQFISASDAAELGAFRFGALEMRPSLMVAYTLSAIDGYTEEGTTNANLTVNSRTAQTLTSRAQLETVRVLGPAEIAYRFGIDGRFGDEEDFTATIGNQTRDFSFEGDNAVLGGFLGAKASFAPSEALQIVGDVEYGFADEEEEILSASLNVTFDF